MPVQVSPRAAGGRRSPARRIRQQPRRTRAWLWPAEILDPKSERGHPASQAVRTPGKHRTTGCAAVPQDWKSS
jgi:hypothetical protein